MASFVFVMHFSSINLLFSVIDLLNHFIFVINLTTSYRNYVFESTNDETKLNTLLKYCTFDEYALQFELLLTKIRILRGESTSVEGKVRNTNIYSVAFEMHSAYASVIFCFDYNK